MNRQLKRANEKSDKRREKEQVRRKEARRERVRVVRARAKERPKPSPKPERPGVAGFRRRFANWYLVFVTLVIASQAFFPQRTDTFAFVIHTLFYAILGYFLVQWLLRRGTARALLLTVAFGALLAFGVEGLKAVLPAFTPTDPSVGSTDPNLLFTALALPGVVAGAWLGLYAYRRNPEM